MSEIVDVATLTPAVETVGSDVHEFVAAGRSHHGRQPIDEHRWSLLGASPEQRLVVATSPRVLAVVVVTPAAGEWDLDLLVDPDHRDDRRIVDSVLSRALDAVRAAGGAAAQLWVHEASDVEAAVATGAGLTERRDLHQLRVPLPLRQTAEPIATRTFEVGRDETAWLEANAAAFAGHRDQGQWTIDDLLERQSEPWFDPDDFLLHEVEHDGVIRLAGFNWTKVHDETLGEIYVIGVHPDFAGRGIGRRLCVAGLEHLASKVTTGMLYVDADNEPAMGLYTSLGFEIDHTNTAFIGTLR